MTSVSMAQRRVLYIESDGQVYLVQKDGVWTFPEEGARIGFSYQVRHATKILETVVNFCRPQLDHFPSEWMFKDDIPLRRDVDPLVQRAINASLARCVVGIVVVNARNEVLLVRSNRGFTKGMWNVPGGFIEYGEAPDRAALREAKEETGLDIQLGRLLGVYMERFESPYFMYGFMYEATARRGDLRLDPTEIEEARWWAPAEAMAATRNPFARKAMAERFSLPPPPPAPQWSPPGASV